MSYVIGIHNHTAGTMRFLKLITGYPCDVERIERAHVFARQEDAEALIVEILNSPNIELHTGLRLDPIISNIANLVEGTENKIELCVCKLAISMVSSYSAKIAEGHQPSVSMEKTI